MKLNDTCGLCRRNAGCLGIKVIPPLNFSTSKEKGFPNKDEVSLRTVWPEIRDSKDDFIKLAEAEGVPEYLLTGSTANSTLVMFDPERGSSDNMVTCFKKEGLKSIC